MDSSKFQDVCNKLKEYYLGDKPVCEETVDHIVDVSGEKNTLDL